MLEEFTPDPRIGTDDHPFFTTKNDIAMWLEMHRVSNYTINNDFTVDVRNGVHINARNVTHFPVRFGRVKGRFMCNYSQLRSLKGFPVEVAGYVDVSHNQLTSLEGLPEEIQGDLKCNDNELVSLKGISKIISGSLFCHSNHLRSLEYAPENVHDLNCSFNELTDLKGLPKNILHVLNMISNPLKDFFISPETKIGTHILTRVSDDFPELDMFVSDNNAGEKPLLNISLSDYQKCYLQNQLSHDLLETKNTVKKSKI